MEKQSVKRKSILHALNVFLVNPIHIHLDRQTDRYVIGYEIKKYRVHYLMFKIDRNLINKTENSVKFNMALDINVREDYRYTIKRTDPKSDQLMKNVVVRVIPTRYGDIPPVYATFYQFNWRKTSKGGYDELSFKIQQCPTIVNGNTINDICYKKVSHQVSFGGTHGTRTYLLLSPTRGNHEIAEWIHMGNVTKGGHHNGEIRPVTISL
jgi:hypothetical protein